MIPERSRRMKPRNRHQPRHQPLRGNTNRNLAQHCKSEVTGDTPKRHLSPQK